MCCEREVRALVTVVLVVLPSTGEVQKTLNFFFLWCVVTMCHTDSRHLKKIKEELLDNNLLNSNI